MFRRPLPLLALGLALTSVSALGSDATNREIARIYADAAIAEKDFAGAIETLQAHLAADPEDGGAWHLLGMTELMAKRPDRAIEAFEKALAKVVPENRGVTLYYEADAYLQKGDASRAAALLRASQVEAISKWSASRALEGGLAPGMSLPDAVPEYPGMLGSSLWFGTGYDSNVLLASNTSLATISRSDIASPRFNLGGQAGYERRGFLGGDLQARGGANFTAHTSTNAQQLNSLGLTAGAEWGRASAGWLGMTHSFGDSAGLSFLNNAGFSFYSWDDTVFWRGRLDQGFGAETEFGIPVRYQKFAFAEGSNPADDRSGLAVGAEATHRRRLRDQVLSAGLGAERLFAKGDNYKSWTFRIPLAWTDPSIGGWNLGARLGVAPAWVRYPDSSTGRHDFNLSAVGSLFRKFSERVSGALTYNYVTNPSNVDAATYNKHMIAMQVIYDLF